MTTWFAAGGFEPSLVVVDRWSFSVIGFGFLVVPAFDGDTPA